MTSMPNIDAQIHKELPLTTRDEEVKRLHSNTTHESLIVENILPMNESTGGWGELGALQPDGGIRGARRNQV